MCQPVCLSRQGALCLRALSIPAGCPYSDGIQLSLEAWTMWFVVQALWGLVWGPVGVGPAPFGTVLFLQLHYFFGYCPSVMRVVMLPFSFSYQELLIGHDGVMLTMGCYSSFQGITQPWCGPVRWENNVAIFPICDVVRGVSIESLARCFFGWQIYSSLLFCLRFLVDGKWCPPLISFGLVSVGSRVGEYLMDFFIWCALSDWIIMDRVPMKDGYALFRLGGQAGYIVSRPIKSQ